MWLHSYNKKLYEYAKNCEGIYTKLSVLVVSGKWDQRWWDKIKINVSLLLLVFDLFQACVILGGKYSKNTKNKCKNTIFSKGMCQFIHNKNSFLF